MKQYLIAGALHFALLTIADAIDINGTVRTAVEKYATVASDSDLLPKPGDKVNIFFKLPGSSAEISVADGHVYEITGDDIMVEIDTATGTVAKDQLVRIKSDKPGKLSAVAASPSVAASAPGSPPTASPVVATQGKNPIVSSSPPKREGSALPAATPSAAERPAAEAEALRGRWTADNAKDAPLSSLVFKSDGTVICPAPEDVATEIPGLFVKGKLVVVDAGPPLKFEVDHFEMPQPSALTEEEEKTFREIAGSDEMRAFGEMVVFGALENPTRLWLDAAKRRSELPAQRVPGSHARRYSKGPRTDTAPAPGASQSNTSSGRDPSFVFVNLSRIIDDFQKVKEAAPKEKGELVAEIKATIKRLTPADVNVVWDVSGLSLNGVPVAMFTPAQADASQRVSAALANQGAAQLQGARGLQIGLVDMNRAFKNLRGTKDAEAKINAVKNAAKQEFDKRAAGYKKELAKVDSLSGAARDQQIDKVRALEQEINGWRATKEKGLQDLAGTMRNELVKKLTDTIAARVSSQPMRLILDRSAAGWSGVPIVLCSSGVPDFSDEVIAALNAGGKSSARPVSLVSSAGLKLGCVDTERVFKAMPGGPPTKEQIEKQEGDMAKMITRLLPLAEAGEYNLIFDTSGQSQSGVPLLVNGASLPDLTDALIAAMK